MGLDVDKLYKEHEQDLAFLKEFGQSANIYQERIGMMTSPCYLRYNNLSQFSNAHGKIDQDSLFRRHPEIPDFMSEFSLKLYPQNQEDKKEKFFNPVLQFMTGLNTCASKGALAGSYEFNKPGAIADTLKMMVYQSGIKDLKLKDKNKELNMLDACFALYNNKYLDVYDGQSFVKRICVENGFGNFQTNVYQDKIYNPLNDIEGFKETVKSLKAEAKEANPWYMRLRNLRNPGDFSQLVSGLDKLKEVNTQDLAKSAQIFKDLAEKADTYLQRKLNDVDTHTELTEKRIALALKVYNICKHGEEKALMLQNNNPLKEENKPLDLDMPNEVVANNLTQVKEEAKQVEKKSEIIEDINKI